MVLPHVVKGVVPSVHLCLGGYIAPHDRAPAPAGPAVPTALKHTCPW